MKRVLFVDKQNSILSAMAEAWFNRHAGGCGAANSGGTTPAASLDARAVQAMHEVGIDIGSRTPKRVDHQLLAQADVVVLMGIELQVFEWVDIRSWRIAEPSNPSLEEVRTLRDHVRQQVDALIEEIRGQHPEPGLAERQWKSAIESSLSEQFMKQTSATLRGTDRQGSPSDAGL
jgi:arsenate reductase